MQDRTPDVYRDVLGIDLPPERLAEILRLYAGILDAVKQLRALDLTRIRPSSSIPAPAGTKRAHRE